MARRRVVVAAATTTAFDGDAHDVFECLNIRKWFDEDALACHLQERIVRASDDTYLGHYRSRIAAPRL